MKGDIQPTFAGPRIIEITVLSSLGDILPFFLEPVRHIDMRIDQHVLLGDHVGR